MSVIHATRNPYDLDTTSSVLLDAEARQKDLMFDANLSTTNILANDVVKSAPGDVQTTYLITFHSGQTCPNDTEKQHQ